MNIKFEIAVSRAKLESFLEYFRQSGYPIVRKEDGNLTEFTAPSCPWYGKITPMACISGNNFGDTVASPASCYIYIRIPDGSDGV